MPVLLPAERALEPGPEGVALAEELPDGRLEAVEDLQDGRRRGPGGPRGPQLPHEMLEILVVTHASVPPGMRLPGGRFVIQLTAGRQVKTNLPPLPIFLTHLTPSPIYTRGLCPLTVRCGGV
jgi:hypothetical protein